MMITRIGLSIIFVCHLIHTSITVSGQETTTPTHFIFNGFKHIHAPQNITLSGIARLDSDSGIIHLTNTSSRLFGRALYPHPISIKSSSTNHVFSFSTTFVFCISPLFETLGGHGMSFFMSPTLDPLGAYPSQYLGLLNATNNDKPYNHIFAIEFDTVQDLEFQDINDNHVGVNINSMTSVNSTTAIYWRNGTNTSINLKGGEPIQAWIQYNGSQHQLNVTIAPIGEPQPSIPLLSLHLNLSQVLQNDLYVGFSGSTGVISGTHQVLSWSFNNSGITQALDLSLLPSINPKTSVFKSTHFKIGMSVSCVALFLLICFLIALLSYKIKHREVVQGWELEFGLHRYKYKELEKATKGFIDKELLGIGGFGRVYRGILPMTRVEVAVKRLSSESEQGEKEFIAEIASMGRLQHQNLVQLLGWSRKKGELILVYEYMINGSLDKVLYGKSSKTLRWEQRCKLLKGVAAGILYLHEGWDQQVLHRDIKASNVLLNANMNGKLGDFGLARLYEHGQNPHTTRVVGTLGYLAPEFARTGKATSSTDVYSFGILLLEVLTARRPIEHRSNENNFLLVDVVWDMYSTGMLFNVVDPKLEGLFDAKEMDKMLRLGLLCSHPEPSVRPSMREVVQILANKAPLPILPPPQVDFTPQQRVEDSGNTCSSSSLSTKSLNSLDASIYISGR